MRNLFSTRSAQREMAPEDFQQRPTFGMTTARSSFEFNNSGALLKRLTLGLIQKLQQHHHDFILWLDTSWHVHSRGGE